MRIRSPGLGGAEAEAVLEMRASTMAYDLNCCRTHYEERLPVLLRRSHTLAQLPLHTTARDPGCAVCVRAHNVLFTGAQHVLPLYAHMIGRWATSLRGKVQVPELAQAGHRLCNRTVLFRLWCFDDNPHAHVVEHLVHHVAELVDDVIFGAIAGIHTEITSFALIFFFVFCRVIEALGAKVKSSRMGLYTNTNTRITRQTQMIQAGL